MSPCVAAAAEWQRGGDSFVAREAYLFNFPRREKHLSSF